MIEILSKNLHGYKDLNHEEKEIVDLVLQGKSNEEISQIFGVKEKTVEKRLSNIYASLGIEDKYNNKRLGLFVRVLNICRNMKSF
jgi:DNA-binding CsgD family transcriptional regulator